MQIQEIDSEYKYYYSDRTTSPTKECILKLSREIASYTNSLPLNYDTSVLLRYDETNTQKLKIFV